MNKVLSFPPVCRPVAAPGPGRRLESLLTELLVRNEDMIGQLRVERLSIAGPDDFLTGMIDQHEKTAAMIRAHLQYHEKQQSY